MLDRVGILVVTPIVPSRIVALRELLATIGKDAAANDAIPFGRMTSVHFARWVLLDEDKDADGATTPAELVFATDADGPLDRHLDELVEVGAAGLDQVYAHCQGYPAAAGRAHAQRLAYLRAHMLDFGALYHSTAGRSVDQVRREADLRNAVEEFLDDEARRHDLGAESPTAIRQAIRAFVSSEPRLAWALTPPDLGRGWWWHTRRWLVLTATAILWLALLPVTVPLFLIFLVVLRRHEKADPEAIPQKDVAELRELVTIEDHAAQNQLTILGRVKSGGFRSFVLSSVLTGFNYLVRYVIPRSSTFLGVATIHFARFFRIDGGRRLMFLSNYDGSWESYIGDFVDRLSFGITAVWSNAVGFPRTRFLLFGGCRSEQLFKALVRENQHPSLVWYSAYRDLTVKNINTNTRIRAGLSGTMDEPQARAWLALF